MSGRRALKPSKDTERLKRTILENALEIDRLQAAFHAVLHQAWSKNPPDGEAALNAYRAFFEQSKTLAFPGGYNGALKRIAAGDPDAVEAAICFLELRPYFFRSGYMYWDILKKVRKAVLSADQSSRLVVVEAKLAKWKAGPRPGYEKTLNVSVSPRKL